MNNDCLGEELTRQQLNDAAYMNQYFRDMFNCFNNKLSNNTACIYIDGTHACDPHIDMYPGGTACTVYNTSPVNLTACTTCGG